ncbi:regulator of chromatin subfamily A member 3-like 1 [Seminavis robusta]|uniref:Regulator of chromatin subfamily A member 3-like 1 n=1 Tax=Seminavis robusta TaxID=568900 RepID=A0A9N8DTR0_9STRA|nr:regulator of chromatin subfamily A member 3-like 1 [Seminavis robusta]|eukprot:Sro243_g097000.1 regulator of chromatin subfamily A member 3-like 1 (1544) ;mRNA; f:71519-76978
MSDSSGKKRKATSQVVIVLSSGDEEEDTLVTPKTRPPTRAAARAVTASRQSKKKKKPKSGFMLFCRDHRPKVKEENPSISFGGMGKKLGEMWRSLSTQGRAKYMSGNNSGTNDNDSDSMERPAKKAKTTPNNNNTNDHEPSWPCSKCTFRNHQSADQCVMCDADNDGGGKMGAVVKKEAAGVSVIADLTLDDDNPVIVKAEAATAARRRNKNNQRLLELMEEESDNDELAKEKESKEEDADDAVEFVTTVNEQKFSHMRCHCTECPFDYNSDLSVNKKSCSLCYCYVCDVPVSLCASWESSSNNKLLNHCNAHDNKHQGTLAGYWKDQRHAKAANVHQEPRQATAVVTAYNNGSLKSGNGPFAPDDAVAKKDPNLTACRRCGWFNRFFHRNFRVYKNLHPIGFLDWCQCCGRVASEQDFGKLQTKPVVPQAGDIFLGTKNIPFTIVARDPREIEKYEQNWLDAADGTANPEWQYDEDEMREDFFRHRFGKRPTLNMILASVAIVKEEDMPTTGTFTTNHKKEDCMARHYDDFAYKNGCVRDPFNYWAYEDYRWGAGPKECSVDETEGIHLKNEYDLILLQQLQHFEAGGFCARKPPTPTTEGTKSILTFDITATLDKTEKTGTFTVKVYVRPRSKGRLKLTGAASFNKLLGSWFNIFPFALSDLSGSLIAEKPDSDDGYPVYSLSSRTVDVPPFTLSSSEWKTALKKMKSEIDDSVQERNSQAKASRNSLCLESTHESKGLGGQSQMEPGFSNVMKRYFKEILPEDVTKASVKGVWVGKSLGVVSEHRRMRKSGESLPFRKSEGCSSPHSNQNAIHDLSYIRADERPLALGLRRSCNSILHGTTTMSSLIAHCENLGHKEMLLVDGLNIELLQFQKQSLQFCVDRETAKGGIQALLWPKLPWVEGDGDVWYNPIIQNYRTTPPNLVRGGIIAEEMGLGKTIISLALILSNPAPAVPASGSSIDDLDNLEDDCTWDKGLYSRTTEGKPKRGHIISRGTLVVCHVSLVGQWIDEAKSKLVHPGLVYSYHGGSRKRIPEVLAANQIVVTTYQTLQSDNTYHAKKSGEEDYVPPLAQVRWWRVICDESHSLSDASTLKSRAVSDLVADHKWLVSGTPVQTSLVDLKNQLNWLGIENVNEMFQVFKTTLEHTNDRNSGQGQSRRRRSYSYGPCGNNGHVVLGHFMFFLRTCLIRHSQKQTYRGTTPKVTLMQLPPKTERTIEVDWDEDELEQYDVLETKALEWYTDFKSRHSKLSKYYVRLQAKLMQTRIACAGGKYPLDDVENVEGAIEDEDEDSDEEEGKSKKKAQVKYSDFAFKSKCKRLIQELKHARDNDPTSKSLVFSQFTSSLKYLQEELPKNGFQFRTLSGSMPMRQRAKALHDFQNDPPTTIFLLSLRSGSVGLNLTQANRVFLLEPCFNPAIELQSIGRVHRLGQKRNVEVVRLFMKDSIETRIATLMKSKYGTSAEAADDGEDDSDGEEDKKPAAVCDKTVALVGSISSDKAAILGEEFDLLYGCSVANGSNPDGLVPDEAPSSGSGAGASSRKSAVL